MAAILTKLIVHHNRESIKEKSTFETDVDEVIYLFAKETGIDKVYIEKLIAGHKIGQGPEDVSIDSTQKLKNIKAFLKNRDIDYNIINEFSAITGINIFTTFQFILNNIVRDTFIDDIAEDLKIRNTVFRKILSGAVPKDINIVLSIIIWFKADIETAIELYNRSGNSFDELRTTAKKYTPEGNCSYKIVLAYLHQLIIIQPAMFSTVKEWNNYFDEYFSKENCDSKDKDYHLVQTI